MNVYVWERQKEREVEREGREEIGKGRRREKKKERIHKEWVGHKGL